MKKIILLSLAFAFVSANAQNEGNSQFEKRKATDEEKTPIYKTWAVGLDIGHSFSMMDLYSAEAGKNDAFSDFGGFELGASLKLEKWVSSAFGWQGQLGFLQTSGTKDEYAFETPLYRGNLNLLINLTGFGGRNKSRLRRHAWIASVGMGTSFNKPEMYTIYNGDGNPLLTEPKYLYTLTGDGTATIIDGDTKESNNNTSFAALGLEWRYRFSEYFDLKLGTQVLTYFGDNVDGSQTLASEEAHVRNAKSNYFGNSANDASLYTSIGVNWYFGGKNTKGDDVIIYTNPLTVLTNRVTSIEKTVGELTEDVDNDHVSDYWDQDKETPEGVIVDGAGVGLDFDQDGVPDGLDEDPFSTPGAAVDTLTGREFDADNDGVPDALDLEPDTPDSSLVNFQGITIPKGSPDGSYFLPSVYFDFNKSFVSAANYQRLAVVANYMKANKDVKLGVVGNTDPVGTEAYNNNLSERRAKAVVKALVNDFDIDESRFEVMPEGESNLISKRNDINRRVEFRIK